MRRAAELLVSVAVIPGGFLLVQELQGDGSSNTLKSPLNAEAVKMVPYVQPSASLPYPAFAPIEHTITPESPTIPRPKVATSEVGVRPALPTSKAIKTVSAPNVNEISDSYLKKPGNKLASTRYSPVSSMQVAPTSRSGDGDAATVPVTFPETGSVLQSLSALHEELPRQMVQSELMLPEAALPSDAAAPAEVAPPWANTATATDVTIDQARLAPPAVTRPDANSGAISATSDMLPPQARSEEPLTPPTAGVLPASANPISTTTPIAQPAANLAQAPERHLVQSTTNAAYFQKAVLREVPIGAATEFFRSTEEPVVESTSAKLVATPPLAASSRSLPTPLFGMARAAVPATVSNGHMDTTSAAGVTASSRVTTLADAIAASYASNPRLLSERAIVRSADFALPAARSAYGPRLDASASLSFTRDHDEILPGTFARNQGFTNSASLVLSQPLLTFGRSAAAEGAAGATIAYRRASMSVVQNEVLLQVIASYAGVIREAGAVTIARENVSLLEKELVDARTRYSERDITLTDVQQVESRLALGQTFLLDAKARLSAQQGTFYSAVGIAPGELSAPDPLPLPTASLEDAYGLADLRNPLLQAARMRERISRAQVAQAKAERRPTVSLQGAADYGTVSDYSSDLRAQRLRGQLTITMPLFDSGGRSAEVGRALEANQSDWQLLDSVGRETRADVAAKWTRLQAASGSVEFNRKALQASLGAYDGAKEQERAGFRTTLELLDLARDLLDVRNRYNTALAEEFIARANLLSSIGALEPQAIVPGLERYDPEHHLTKVSNHGSIPLLNGLLSGIDQVWSPDLITVRPSRDAASVAGIAGIDTSN